MKITKIVIENYKSIKHMEITMPDPEEYGGSSAVFLLGVNESGKSNILEAIHRLEVGFRDDEYHNLCNTHVQEGKEDVRVTAFAEMTSEDISRHVPGLLIEETPHLLDDVKNITRIVMTKTVSLRKGRGGEKNHDVASVSVNEDFGFGKYIRVDSTKAILQDSDEGKNHVERADSTADGTPLITQMDSEEVLAEIISANIKGELPKIFPVIMSWKATPDSLIADAINLPQYAADPRISKPLTNVFFLIGKNDRQSVNDAIECALGSEANRMALAEELSNAATTHINGIWEKSKVNIKFQIDGDFCRVFVQDTSTRQYLRVQQRSDGFKQFVSLLLTLSAEHKGELLENTVLLLDEPDAHLHPSGIREMRTEIFEMARNNQIVVATHSPSMVDIETPQRHCLVTKGDDGETMLRFLGRDVPMKDEEVMRMAFGINVMKEILPDNLLLVEGETDKQLLQFALNHQKRGDVSVTLKSSGGSNILTLANILDFHDINAAILLDGDKEGKKWQKKIIDNQTYFDASNVFTLPDLVDGLPDGATIEDLLPVSCIKKTLKDSGKKHNLDAAPNRAPVLSKITALNPELRSPSNPGLAKIKSKIAKRVIQEFPCRNERESDLLFKLARALLDKLPEAKRA